MDKNLMNNNVDNLEYATIVTENKLLRASFSWMAVAMLLTSVTAFLFGFMPGLTSLLLTETEVGLKPTMLAYVVMFAPLIFALTMSFALNRLSYPALIGLFIAYSVVNGISFSFIFHVYQ